MTVLTAPAELRATRQFDQETINRYADLVGDHNPIHVDEEFARSTPFGGTIAHGMLVLSLASNMLEKQFGDRWRASGKLKVRFKAPTKSGATVTAQASLKEGEQPADNKIATYRVECRNEQREVVIVGTAQVTL
ncbi:MAG: hypothetical protein A2172_01210 [Candidatus Woykebacteria bacterium RBG_13_40_15]|uniref:MaoC-like domain-containing protein n=1 Tax=Candidatus Woykebacteria bacterium RBG_13_40_15 TaxID=1802593 RepID=A0A1G1W8Z1_9BACT|nr:MAG: hypothetical protein A2172_01210 [Candidatus Woykebacteria bacterium RBG_13_40_15]